MISPDDFDAVGNTTRAPKGSPQATAAPRHQVVSPPKSHQSPLTAVPPVGTSPVRQSLMSFTEWKIVIAAIIWSIFLVWLVIHFGKNGNHISTPTQASPAAAPLVTPTPEPLIQPPPGDGIFLGNIPSLNAQVTSVRFFESGINPATFDTRIYADKFIQQGTRYIYWELNFTAPQSDHRIPFEIEAVWSKITGEIFEKKIHQGYIDAGLPSIFQNEGFGSDMVGQAWSPGRYKIELYMDGKLVARAPFDVVENLTATNGSRDFLGTVSSLNIKATDLHLFESGTSLTPKDARTYTNKFYQTTTRFVGWELTIQKPPLNRMLPLEIVTIWSRITGETIAKHIRAGYIDSGSAVSYQSDGWGSAVAGQFWLSGAYKLELYTGGNLLASTRFEVVGDSAQNTSGSRPPNILYDQSSSSLPATSVQSTSKDRYSNTLTGDGQIDLSSTSGGKGIYWAQHKHAFGGSCSGQLQLSKDSLLFLGNEHELRLSRSDIKQLNGEGITDLKGHNWHFRIEGKKSDEVKRIFRDWYER